MADSVNLSERLAADTVFRDLFNQSSSIHEAVRLALSFGVDVSVEDVFAYRSELRAMIGQQVFHLDCPGSARSLSSFTVCGDDIWVGIPRASTCSDHHSACSDY